MKQASSMLRQGKLVPVVQSVLSGLRLMLTTPLMKAEKDEMVGIVAEALSFLNNDAALRKVYPLELRYASGEEKRLFDEMQELLGVLNEETMSGVGEMMKNLAAKKQTALDAGQAHLDAKEYDQARKVFGGLTGEFPDDGALRGAIGEKVLAAGLYEDAVEHLSAAVALDPHALNLYNRLAIALRKLGRFDVAEDYYLKALPLAPNDPYLLFNMGRLYAEWGKWDKALEFGEKSGAAQPDFEEAKKLASFARKKLG
jgi:tetratricopeptide (TPR) repeat protein